MVLSFANFIILKGKFFENGIDKEDIIFKIVKDICLNFYDFEKY